ncbi:SufE family protein [Coralliovum pocilloporae]|uniref:SufE family protein n=1 Tax=Coralliovum pocilloporae TaxID=3066369 RepID=UPI00330713A4
MTTIDDIVDNFEFLDDWEDRYKYLIELGRDLKPIDDTERTDQTKVQGCVSQVWLITETDQSGDQPRLTFRGDSDAMIVRGLIAIVIALYSGKTVDAIVDVNPNNVFDRIGLRDHLTPQRSNGLSSMLQRIRSDAMSLAA